MSVRTTYPVFPGGVTTLPNTDPTDTAANTGNAAGQPMGLSPWLNANLAELKSVQSYLLGGSAGGVAAEIGSIKAWPTATPPSTWMVADGSAVSRSLYPDLFTLIGTNYGVGDGSTTFNLPDLRGRFILSTGQSNAAGNTLHNLRDVGGEEKHVLITAELAAHSHTQPAHNHTATDSGHTHTQTGTTQVLGGTGNTIWTLTAQAANSPCTTVSGNANISVGNAQPAIANTGSGTAHNIMPPFLCMVYIIKVSGGGGSTAQAPIADNTQTGLMKQLSGNASDYVGGDNASHNLIAAIPQASTSGAGLLDTLSGNASDYVGGDNNCHALPSPTGFYGTDTTNNGAYVVTVAASFVLTPGVTVYVTPSIANAAASPTLNVNSTGAKAIVNRANLALAARELPANKMFGVTYDGTSWRICTFLCKFGRQTGITGGGATFDCAGYDAVNIYVTVSSNGMGLTLQHVAEGIQVVFDIGNGTSGAMAWWVNVTPPESTTAMPAYFVWANGFAGAALVRMDSASPPTAITTGQHFMAHGFNSSGNFFCK